MAETIKGIKIEFEGSTVGLDNALKKINKEASQTANKLKSIDRALKYNPHNVTLLTEKQKLLKERVEDARRSLDRLKNVQKQLDAKNVDKNSAEYRKLQKEIVIANSKLKRFTMEMLRFGNAKFNAVGGAIQDVGRKLTNVTRRARQAAGAIAGIALYKGFQRLKTLDDVSTELEKLGYRGQRLENIMDAAKFSVSGTKYALTDMSKVAKGALGSGVEKQYALADYLDRVADLAAVGGTSVSEMGALMNKALSKGTVDARLLNQMNANGIPIYNLLADSLGVTTEELNKMVRTGQVGFNDLYKATEKYDGLAKELGTETLSGAVTVLGQQFGLMGADFLAGAYEPIKEGVQGIVKYLKDLQANGTIKEWGTAVGEAIKAFVGWFKTGELAIDGMSQKGQSLVTAFYPVISVIGTLVKMFMALPTPVKQFMAAFALIGGPVLTFIGGFTKIIGVVGNAIKFLGMFSKAFSVIRIAIAALGGPLTLFIAITSAVAIAVYKNWDKIKAVTLRLFASVKATFSRMTSAITQPFQNAWNKLKAIVNKIKGLFPLKIGKIFSGLKLPHFSVKGGKAPFGIGGKGSLPHISVKWYAQGGIFDAPSVIGVGERGAEAVVPLDRLWDKLDAIADSSGSPVVVNVYGSDNMSVDELASAVERKLILMQKRRTQAWA